MAMLSRSTSVRTEKRRPNSVIESEVEEVVLLLEELALAICITGLSASAGPCGWKVKRDKLTDECQSQLKCHSVRRHRRSVGCSDSSTRKPGLTTMLSDHRGAL